MRGKVRSLRPFMALMGITPAYAGKSEKTDKKHETCLGSPPPMRGKVWNLLIYSTIPGTTPAYAGKSKLCSAMGSNVRDHPRLCGEKYFCFWG